MRSHSAFTLLELLIVMILILVIMAMVAPSLQRVRARSELRSAAQNLQGELYATRLAAMKAGEAYLFRYQSQSGVYEILPKSVYDALNPEPLSPDLLDPRSTRSVGTPIRQGLQSVSDSTSGVQISTLPYRKSLPGQFTFGTVKTTSVRDPSETLAPNATRSVGTVPDSSFGYPLSPVTAQQVWSEPIFFFPNGRTSNGTLELLALGDYRFQIELTLRGLTGTARLGNITSSLP